MSTTRLAECIMKSINKEANKSNVLKVAKIVKVDPLTINLNGLEYTECEFLINASIKEKNATLTTNNGEYISTYTGELRYNNYFNIGDKVVVMLDSGEIILLCKVV